MGPQNHLVLPGSTARSRLFWEEGAPERPQPRRLTTPGGRQGAAAWPWPRGTDRDSSICKAPPRARGGGPGAAGAQNNSISPALRLDQPKPDTRAKPSTAGLGPPGSRGAGGEAGEAGLVGRDPPKLLKRVPARHLASQPLPSKPEQNTTKSKTNTGKQTQVTPTGQRSPEAPAQTLHKTSPGTGTRPEARARGG